MSYTERSTRRRKSSSAREFLAERLPHKYPGAKSSGAECFSDRKPMAYYLIKQGEPNDVIKDALSVSMRAVEEWRDEVEANGGR